MTYPKVLARLKAHVWGIAFIFAWTSPAKAAGDPCPEATYQEPLKRATCYRNEGWFKTALEVINNVPDTNPGKEAVLNEIVLRMIVLKVEVPGDLASRVTIDGKEAQNVNLDEGAHRVVVDSPGHQSWSAIVEPRTKGPEANGYNLLVLRIPPLIPETNDGKLRRWLLPASLVAAGVSLAAAVTTGIMSASAASDANKSLARYDELARSGAPFADVLAARDETWDVRGRRDNLKVAAMVTGGAGLVFGMVAVVTLLSRGPNDSPSGAAQIKLGGVAGATLGAAATTSF